MSKNVHFRRTMILLVALLTGGAIYAASGLPSQKDEGDGTIGSPYKIEIGPVAGLTTAWHPSPANVTVPVGTVLLLDQFAPPEATVVWTNALEVARDEDGSIAECAFTVTGVQVVVATVDLPNGSGFGSTVVFDVVDFNPADVTVGSIQATVDPFDLDENATNEETMEAYFGGSIASFTSVARGEYLTSVDRDIILSTSIEPVAFVSLIEWRIDGVATTLLGPIVSEDIDTIGAHTISVGPPASASTIEVETYSVTITSHQTLADIVPEGVPVLFEAVTEPAGYEQHITWVSTTKYGDAKPVVGQGPSFTAIFEDTFGDDPVNGYFQWLGVRADNSTFGQDQKTGACCPPEGGCIIVPQVECQAINGEYLGDGSVCLPGLCPTVCPGGGDCCASNGSPGCDDADCCDCVCAADPFCCDNTWDGICAGESCTICEQDCGCCVGPSCGDGTPDPGEVCGESGLPACPAGMICDNCVCIPQNCGAGAGDCCTSNGSPGCDDADCCDCVCATNAFCCDTIWDRTCADEACTQCESDCDCCPLCVVPGEDCWTTQSCDTDAGQAILDFCERELPAGFFEPGSEPFTDVLALGGAGEGQPDTIMLRTDEVCLTPDQNIGMTPLEIIDLNLESCMPIVVRINAEPVEWDVAVDLSEPRTVEIDPMPNVPVSDCVPDVAGEGESEVVIDLPNCGQVSTMRVALQITHPRVGDLVIDLVHVESGQSVRLMNRPGSNNDPKNPGNPDGMLCTGDEVNGNVNANLNVVFDDSAANSIDTQMGSLNRGESFKPTELLSGFQGFSWCGFPDGEPAWRLIVTDARQVLFCDDGAGSCEGASIGDPCGDMSGTCQPDDPGEIVSWTLDFDQGEPQGQVGDSLTYQRTNATGGTFVSSFHVAPRFTFTTHEGVTPPRTRVLDTSVNQAVIIEPLQMGITQGAVWTSQPAEPIVVCDPQEERNFFPGVLVPTLPADPQCCVVTGHAGPGHLHVTSVDCSGCNGACCLDPEFPDVVGTCVVVLTEFIPPDMEISAREKCTDPMGQFRGRYMGNGTNCADSDMDGIPDIFEIPRDGTCCDEIQKPWLIPTNSDDDDTDGDLQCDGCETFVLGTLVCDGTDPADIGGSGCPDCNINGVCDQCDLFRPCGDSPDCNGNGIPDECEVDTDGDGAIDDCDNCDEAPNANGAGTCTAGVVSVCVNDADCDSNSGEGDGVCSNNQEDADGDGFGAACDCADDNADVNPDATEDCNDGIDNDCDDLIDAEDPDCP